MYSRGQHAPHQPGQRSWPQQQGSQWLEDEDYRASNPRGLHSAPVSDAAQRRHNSFGDQQHPWRDISNSVYIKGGKGTDGAFHGNLSLGGPTWDRNFVPNAQHLDNTVANPHRNPGWNGSVGAYGAGIDAPSNGIQSNRQRMHREPGGTESLMEADDQANHSGGGFNPPPSQQHGQQPLYQSQGYFQAAHPYTSSRTQQRIGQEHDPPSWDCAEHRSDAGDEHTRPGSLQGQGRQAIQSQRAPADQHQHRQPLPQMGDDRLVSVQDLPEPFRKLFPNFRYFNPVQSESFQEAFGSDVNMVVSAPTGSGKTGVMELALLRLLSEHLRAVGGPDTGTVDRAGSGGNMSHATGVSVRPLRGTNKAVYVAPLRALVQEKCKDWQARFGALLGLSVLELTGDSEPEAAELEAADVLCTTPEKLDALSRKLSEQNRSATFLSDIRLVLIDEVHLLNEAERGSALEAGVVSRLTQVSAFPELREHAISRLRFVAVSATIPNVKDIATWLRVPPQGLKVYGEEMRPVRLRTLVRTYAPAKNDFLFERRLDTFLPGVLAENSSGKPALVFCSSRKGTVDSATYLASRAAGSGPDGSAGGSGAGHSYIRDAAHAERLAAAAREVGANKQLQTCLLSGVGFHNAAMETQQREVVERLFLAGDLPVLCSTSTLALGVNLPAHLVVIRGTRRYCGADGGGAPGDEGGSVTGYKEYDRSVCLQMVGRAGRPQFDTEGVAVIMTQKETYDRYANLLGGSEAVESCLHDCFAEHLNAEVVLATVRDLETATQWLRTTFLYVRVRQSPRVYGLDPPAAAMASDANFDRWLTERLVGRAVTRLAEIGLVAQDPATGALRALEPGRIMAHSYLRLETMKAITQVGLRAGMMALLRVIAVAEEFSHIRLRRGEKRVLNDINKRVTGEGAIKYPVPADGPAGAGAAGRAPKPKDRITKPTEKIFIMVNEALSDASAEVLDYSMRQELECVLRVGQRIAAAMARYFDFRQALAATANALCLSKALRQRMWEDSSQAVRQLPDIGRLLAQRLAAAGLGGLRQLAAAEPRRIEAVTQKAYPFGNTIRSHLAKRLPPDVQLRLRPLGAAPNKGTVTVEVEISRSEARDGHHHHHQGSGASASAPTSRTPAHLLMGLSNSDRLLRCERLTVETFTSPYKFQVAVAPPPQAPRGEPLHVLACLILDRMCGLDVHASIRVGVNHGSVVVVDGAAGDGAADGLTGAAAGLAAARAADINEAALQPSPFPARPSGIGGGGEVDDAEESEMEPMPVIGAPGRNTGLGGVRDASQAGLQQGQSSQRVRRDRGTAADAAIAAAAAVTAGWPAPRQQVITEAPALAEPAFALGASGLTGPSALNYQWPPNQSPPAPQQQHQDVPPQADLRSELQQAASTTQSQQPLCGTSDSLARQSGASGAGKGASKRGPTAGVRGAAAGGGGKKGQGPGLIMSGASLAGAKQVPAFARLLALAGKPAATAAEAPAAGDGDASPGLAAAGDGAGADDPWSRTCQQDGDGRGDQVIWASCDLPDIQGPKDRGTGSARDGPRVTDGAGRPSGTAAVERGSEEEALDGLFDFLMGDTDDGHNIQAQGQGQAVKGLGPGSGVPAVSAERTRESSGGLPAPKPSSPQADAARMPPPGPPKGALGQPSTVSPSAGASQRGGSLPVAPHSLSPQVLQQLQQRPGMMMGSCSASLGLAGTPVPAPGGPALQPAQSLPASAAGGRQRPQPSGSQAAILGERKKRMLAGSRDRGTAAALQLMQQHQARTAAVAAAAGTASAGRPAVPSYTDPWACSGGAASGGGREPAARGPAVAVRSSPASSSVSAMRRSGRAAGVTGRGMHGSAIPEGPLEEGDGEYDSTAAAAAAAEKSDARPGKGLCALDEMSEWSESESDGDSSGGRSRGGMFNLLRPRGRGRSAPMYFRAVEGRHQEKCGLDTTALDRRGDLMPPGDVQQHAPQPRTFGGPSIPAAPTRREEPTSLRAERGGDCEAAAAVAVGGGSGSGSGRAPNGPGWSEFVDESDGGPGLPARRPSQQQQEQHPRPAVQTLSAWRAVKAPRSSYTSSAATASRLGGGVAATDAHPSAQTSPSSGARGGDLGPRACGTRPTSTTGVLTAAGAATAAPRAVAAVQPAWGDHSDPWVTEAHPDGAGQGVPAGGSVQEAGKDSAGVYAGSGGNFAAADVPAAGVRPGLSRYSALATLSQGLRKRKGPALSQECPSQLPATSALFMPGADPGGSAPQVLSLPRQDALLRPRQPSHHPAPPHSIEPSAAVGWRPPTSRSAPAQPQPVAPQQQQDGEQIKQLLDPASPLDGAGAANIFRHAWTANLLDDDVDPTQAWLSSLLF